MIQISDFKQLIGKALYFDPIEFMGECNMEILDLTHDDYVTYFANKEADICIKTRYLMPDNSAPYFIIEEVCGYPNLKEPTQEQKNNALITTHAIIGSIADMNFTPSEDEFNNRLIDSYNILKEKGHIR